MSLSSAAESALLQPQLTIAVGAVGIGGLYTSWRAIEWVASLSVLDVGRCVHCVIRAADARSNMFFVGGIVSTVLAGYTYTVLKCDV